MAGLGTTELLIILGILILLFGAKKIPELSRTIGQSIKEFRQGQEEGSSDAENSSEDVSSEES